MQDDGQPLRRRVPGDARSAPGPSTRPVLSPTVLRRMQAAVDAAKAEAALEDEQPTGPIPRVTDTSLNGVNAAAGHDAADTDRGRMSRKGKRSPAAVSSAIRRRRRDSAPATGTAANGTAAASGTVPAKDTAPAQPAAEEKRPRLPAIEPPMRTVPTYGPFAEAGQIEASEAAAGPHRDEVPRPLQPEATDLTAPDRSSPDSPPGTDTQSAAAQTSAAARTSPPRAAAVETDAVPPRRNPVAPAADAQAAPGRPCP